MQRADLEGQGGQTAAQKGRVQLPVVNNLQAKKSQHELEIEAELARFEAEQREALAVYQAHPLHQAIVPFVVEAATERRLVDYEL